ncbi:septal ring lytic transglycosylase RlpA family protein [Niveispirillum sp. KHB5.9]|uniref:septal ring lytic transglycosylase RlpA family protein n=1 Tax=Niveispirillum sp. KHB5.9 TaxID=3400269 RepID=UPI003A89A136
MRLLVPGLAGLCLLACLPAAATPGNGCLIDQPVDMTASWYGPGHHGRPTANGERFDRNAFTAAHPCLPFGSILDVADPRTGRSVRVRINDRGPFKPGRSLDLSEAAAAHVGLSLRGVGKVRVTPVAPRRVCPAERPCLSAR